MNGCETGFDTLDVPCRLRLIQPMQILGQLGMDMVRSHHFWVPTLNSTSAAVACQQYCCVCLTAIVAEDMAEKHAAEANSLRNMSVCSYSITTWSA